MKKAIKMVMQLALLYGFYLVGTAAQKSLHLPIPGSIIAMILLFALLTTNVIKDKWLADGGQFLLSHLPLLFVPATVGIINHLSLFRGTGILSIIVVVVSTVIVMVSAGTIGQWGVHRQHRKRQQLPEGTKERIEA